MAGAGPGPEGSRARPPGGFEKVGEGLGGALQDLDDVAWVAQDLIEEAEMAGPSCRYIVKLRRPWKGKLLWALRSCVVRTLELLHHDDQ
jgi:hypothetical protein